MTNIGIIGNGAFTQFLIEIIKDIPDLQITAISARNEDKLKETIQKNGIDRYYTNHKLMLEDNDIDMVLITTPPYLHYEQSMDALKSGKHVIVEKPPALKPEELDEMEQLAKSSNLKIAVDYMMRFNKIYGMIRSLFESDAVGKISRIELNNLASDTALDESHWFWDKKQSGGIFIEHGVHFFDVYNSFLGSPKVIYSKTYSRENNPAIEDRCYTMIEYPGNTFASFFHSFDRPGIQETTFSNVYFENGYVKINGWNAHSIEGNFMVEESQLDLVKNIIGVEHITKEEKLDQEIYIKREKLNSPVWIHFNYTSPKSIRDVYKENVTGLLLDFVSTLNTDKEPRTSINNVKDSLRVAYESAEKAQ